jgi:hypothetical protein
MYRDAVSPGGDKAQASRQAVAMWRQPSSVLGVNSGAECTTTVQYDTSPTRVSVLPDDAESRLTVLWRTMSQPSFALLLAYLLPMGAFLGVALVTRGLAMYHFTYWSLSVSTVGIVAWCAGAVSDAWARRTPVRHASTDAFTWEEVFLVYGAGAVLGVLALVMFLITLLPAMDSNIIAAQTEGIELGIANVGNLFMHYLPFFVFLVALLLRRQQFIAALHVACGCFYPLSAEGRFVVEATCVAQFLLAPSAFAGIYNARFNFQEEYGVSVPRWQILLIGYTFLVLFWVGGRAVVWRCLTLEK